MRRCIAAGFFLMVVLAAHPGLTQVIPPGMEGEVLKLLEPYGVEAPVDQVAPGVVLDEVAIEQSRIRLVLQSEKGSLTLLLQQVDPGLKDAYAATLNFTITQDGKTDDPALAGAADKLTEALRKNDDRPFWGGLEVPPDVQHDAQQEVVPVGGFRITDYIGEAMLALLLLLLLLNIHRFLPAWRGHTAGFYVSILVVIALGAGYRLMLLDETEAQTEKEDVPCSLDEDCNDFNACTVDMCINHKCVSDWDPPEGTDCCRTVEDCPAPAERCVEAFCDPDTNRCGEQPSPKCDLGRYEGDNVLPYDNAVGWFYAIPAKVVGNTPEAAATVNLASSVLALLLLALMLLAWGAEPGAVLGATFLFAVFPMGLATAPLPSPTSLATALMLLLLLSAAPLVSDGSLTRRQGILLALLQGLLFLLAFFARLEAVLVLPLGALLLVLSKRRWPLCPVASGLLGVLVVGALVARGLLVTSEQWALTFPAWGGSLQAFGRGLDVLFLQGVAIPFIMVLLALVGGFVIFKENRPLGWLSILLLVLLGAAPLLFELDAASAVRYLLLPSLAFPILGGYGFWWVRNRNIRYAWMITAILVLYFSFFPLSRMDSIKPLSDATRVSNRFIEL